VDFLVFSWAGIWDNLTKQQVAEYVTQRIEKLCATYARSLKTDSMMALTLYHLFPE